MTAAAPAPDQPVVGTPVAGNPFLEKVAQAYPLLTPAERKVADVLLAAPLVFARTPMAIIGDRAGASAPSIMRFCRALGCTGLTELKQVLVASLGRHDTAVLFHLPPPKEHDGAGGMLDAAESMLGRLRAQHDSQEVREAAALLAGAAQIACVASYQLGLAAGYARDALLRHGVGATVPASTMTAPPAHDIPAGAAGLFFCQGMPDAAMLDAIICCRRHGAPAVVLSDVVLAPFVPASVTLVLGAAAAPGSAGALAAHLLMTDLLLVGISRYVVTS